MSLEISVDPKLVEMATLGCLAALTLTFGVIAVKARDSVYAALSLAFVGSSVAGLIALLGFGYLAAFHLMIYVGAAVIFITFTVLMLREPPAEFKEMKIPALLNALLLGLAFYLAVSPLKPEEAKIYESLSEAASLIFGKYWFAFLILVYSLATVVIEAIAVARGEKE